MWVVTYGLHWGMIEMVETHEFSRWFDGLKDDRAVARIRRRLYELAVGHAGDVKPAGAGVSELRIDYGPGYRVYFLQKGNLLIILLAGGDKKTQEKDIRLAQTLAQGF